MRDRKKRNIIIDSLCCLIVFMGISYEVLSQTLNINGTANMRSEWDIKITDISEASTIKNLIITDGITEIGPVVFKAANIENLRFSGTLKVIGSKAFESNKLTNTGLGKLPSSLTSLATDAFSNNPDLTQITLTSPKDLPGWPNGGTVDGKTVTYER